MRRSGGRRRKHNLSSCPNGVKIGLLDTLAQKRLDWLDRCGERSVEIVVALDL